MPELPEVETIRRTLSPHLAGRKVERVEVRNPKFIAGATPEEFAAEVEGLKIKELGRKGKFLLLTFEHDSPAGRESFPSGSGAPGRPGELAGADIAIHLKMAGQLVVCSPGADLGPTREKHTHVVFHLDDGHELRYIDLRHFGRVYYLRGDRRDPHLASALKTLAGLGPEPREGGLDWPTFRAKLAPRKARIKPLLLDQSFVAGLGNIYVDECLFRAGIHPLRRAASLSDEEARALFEAMVEVIEEAIRMHGTTFRDYVDGEGRRGAFAERLQAYGRTGEACPRCGTAIERMVIGGRSSHFCPACQLRGEDPE